MRRDYTSEDFKAGQQGYLVWCSQVIHVEFVGYGYYEPDWPSDRERHYRALESVELKDGLGRRWATVRGGDIFQEGGEFDEVLHTDYESAAAEAKAERAASLKRKQEELAKLLESA
jgi:hypothetical protein